MHVSEGEIIESRPTTDMREKVRESAGRDDTINLLRPNGIWHIERRGDHNWRDGSKYAELDSTLTRYLNISRVYSYYSTCIKPALILSVVYLTSLNGVLVYSVPTPRYRPTSSYYYYVPEPSRSWSMLVCTK